MAKLLRIRDRILLGLAIAGDIFWEVKTVHGLAGASFQNAYGFTPEKYKKTNYTLTVGRLLRSGQIEKKIVNGEPYLEISSKGQRKLIRSFPLAQLQSGSWDKKFRVLIFDIPEKSRDKRDALRSKLIELGFGMLQKSVYISPFAIEEDIREFLEDNNLDNFSSLFITSSEDFGNTPKMVERVWKVNSINAEYKRLLDQFKKNADMSKFIAGYLDLVAHDPMLPTGLLPKDWVGVVAKNIFKKLVASNKYTTNNSTIVNINVVSKHK